MSPEIIDSMKCSDKHKAVGNEDEYKIWRNKVLKLIHNAKELQYQTFINNDKGNPSSIYNFFQEVGVGIRKHRQSSVTSVKVGDTLIDDSTEMAKVFNNFFVNIASKLK